MQRSSGYLFSGCINDNEADVVVDMTAQAGMHLFAQRSGWSGFAICLVAGLPASSSRRVHENGARTKFLLRRRLSATAAFPSKALTHFRNPSPDEVAVAVAQLRQHLRDIGSLVSRPVRGATQQHFQR